MQAVKLFSNRIVQFFLGLVPFKMAALMYKAIYGTAPPYLSQVVCFNQCTWLVFPGSAWTTHLLVPSIKLPLATGPSQLLDPRFERVFRTLLSRLRLCRPSASVWKLFNSRPRSLTLLSILLSLLPTVGASWSGFITWITLEIHDWLTDWRLIQVDLYNGK